MFHSARLRLTAWYLVIIITITLSFSVIIYRRFTANIEVFSRSQSLRHQTEESLRSQRLDIILLQDVRHQTIVSLIILNGVIWVVSGMLGYFLAGKTLEPIQEMIDEQNRFTADASHELRTPLTALKTELEVALRDKKLNLAEAKELLESNLEETNKLRSLADSLLMLAQDGQPNQKNSFGTVPIAAVVEAALEQVRPMAKQKKITITSKVVGKNTLVDEPSVAKLLVILLDNAVKYSHPGGKVLIKTHRDDRQLYIEVIDHGIGISSVELPHVFKRFYRADAARFKKGVGGYGLGLAIAQRLVEQSRGKISVTSLPGKETIFSVTLPIQRS